MSQTFHYNSSPTMRLSRDLSFRSSSYRYSVIGSRYNNGETTFGSISMSRSEAIALRRELNRMLKMTAPPRKRAS